MKSIFSKGGVITPPSGNKGLISYTVLSIIVLTATEVIKSDFT